MVLGLTGRLGGTERLASSIEGDPTMPASPGGPVPVLQAVAGASDGQLYLLVINVSPNQRVAAEVGPWHLALPRKITATVLNGPSPTAFNT